MSPDEAEAEAARLGLPPLASQPDPNKFDPMDEAWWTLPMTIAWIAWRNHTEVLDCYDPFRLACYFGVIANGGKVLTEWRIEVISSNQGDQQLSLCFGCQKCMTSPQIVWRTSIEDRYCRIRVPGDLVAGNASDFAATNSENNSE